MLRARVWPRVRAALCSERSTCPQGHVPRPLLARGVPEGHFGEVRGGRGSALRVLADASRALSPRAPARSPCARLSLLLCLGHGGSGHTTAPRLSGLMSRRLLQLAEARLSPLHPAWGAVVGVLGALRQEARLPRLR